MDKSQAIDNFWNRFGIPAYDENTVPQDAPLPRITYNVETDSLDNPVGMNASLWYRSRSWKDISKKAEEIGEYITKMFQREVHLHSACQTPMIQSEEFI